jgi:dephospho-CoA kinase
VKGFQMRIGVTGGIACGKSKVLELFAHRGWNTIRTDDLAKEILQKDCEIHSFLLENYGEWIFNDHGSSYATVNTKRLGSIVFSDQKSLKSLEEILHPKVRQEWMRRCLIHKSLFHMIEVPLLFEKSLEFLFDRTICVVVDSDRQRKRLLKRSLTSEEGKARIDIQMNLEEKVKLAHLVISSSGSLQALDEQVNEIHNSLVF